MKIIITSIIFILLASINAFAQMKKIQGTENKTTTLIFPGDIVHIDLGIQNPFIGVQHDQGVPNLLKLRLSSGFKEITNMLVVTQDEKVYSFEVSYSDSLNLDKYVHIIKKEEAVNALSQVPVPKEKEEQLIAQKDSLSPNKILDMVLKRGEGLVRSEVVKKGKIKLCLRNIYVHDEDLYFHIEITNRSNLKYSIDFYNFFMCSNLKKALKTTTSQEVQIPFSFMKEIKEINAGQVENVVLKLKKFTLEDDKIANFEIYEKEGGRHLRIKISNTELITATKL